MTQTTVALGIMALVGAYVGCALLMYRLGKVAGAREAVMRIDTVLHLNRTAEITSISPYERLQGVLNVLKKDRRELNAGLPLHQRVPYPEEK